MQTRVPITNLRTDSHNEQGKLTKNPEQVERWTPEVNETSVAGPVSNLGTDFFKAKSEGRLSLWSRFFFFFQQAKCTDLPVFPSLSEVQ